MAEQHSGGADEFQDPLEDYEPPTYDDELERALVEETIAAIETQPFVSIQPDIPVHSAIEMLVGRDIACAMVVDGDRLIGIFSDRDALDKAALEYEQVKDKPVRDVMTKNPFYVRDDDSPAAVLCVMAAEGYRHVPVVDADNKVVGIVSPPRMVDFLQAHFNDGD